ncbi:type II toxin-antitoxin system RelE/ParE family toxin [Methylomonas paludis]|uniref:Type II toxin-antitoxin system RelE/ParE family toxin n=1 Tax=Methylomonas paludis TaxID=1173101 RepID=A0A975R9R7_9GAMM|nr:type II toxin-antitoxin system RelE/ParE family toxin [Methylomonas paludis]QWF70563.1 type II toxin-antitoxin system RelE/ParE family toxin [Methylomonas paludis]
MYIIRTLPQFDKWLSGIKDGMTKRRLVARIKKAQLGNLGDIKSVGEGVFEMREHFGAGYRMYYLQHGAVMIIMLGGGDKSSQADDIAKAKQLANLLED